MANVNANLAKANDGTAPQYKIDGEQAFDPVEGSDGGLHTKILAGFEVDSKSDMPLGAGEAFNTPFRRARGNKVQLTIRTNLAVVSDNLRVTIWHFNNTTQRPVFNETLRYRKGNYGRLYETDLYGKYYQIVITNMTDTDAIVERFYVNETIGVGAITPGPGYPGTQVMERGRKTYDHNTIALSERDVIFSTTDPFELDHLYYVYKPSNPENVNPDNSHAPLVELRTGNSWTANTGIATFGTGSTIGRVNPYPAAIAGHINNSHFPQYNILQYDIKNGVYAFEIKDIVAPEGFQFSVYMPGTQQEGETSELCYQLRGRIK